jgi:hypothetical protein
MSRKLSVVKQGGPPANPPQRSYLDFEKFVKLERDLCEFNDRLFQALEKLEDNPAAGAWFAEMVLKMPEEKLRRDIEDYIKAAAWYERDELYEADEDGRQHVRRHVIAEHVAALLGSFPVAPHSPEVFVRRMIEEVVVFDPWASNLERGCREMIRKAKFPDIATLLRAIGEDDSTESFVEDLLERDASGEYQIIVTYRELAAELGKAKFAIEEAKELKEPIHISHVSRFKRGDRVSHLRFGAGEVVQLLGKQISVRFDEGGLKTVIDRFLEPA